MPYRFRFFWSLLSNNDLFIPKVPVMLSRALHCGFLIFFLTAPTVLAQQNLEVIPLNNRQAEELIPMLRPLLGSNETITGMHNQLIVRASPRKLREIKSILEKIDAELKNLRITVKQGFRSKLNKLEQGIDADIPLGEAGRVIINSADKNVGGLIIEGEEGVLRGRLLHKKSELDEMDTQVITTLEGNPATIYFSQRVPLNEKRRVRNGSKFIELESTRFKDVRTGFIVLPHIRGDQVVLEISPQQSRVKNGKIETTGLNTVIKGQVGKWLELGGLSLNENEQSSGIASNNFSGRVQKRSIFVKVELQ